MADKVYKCKHFNVDLNEEVIISFYPNTNENNADALEIEKMFISKKCYICIFENDLK